MVSDTELLLSWVHSTKAVDPKKYVIPNSDKDTADKMKDIVEQYEKMLREPPHKRKRFLKGYLVQQGETLQSIQQNLRENQLNEGQPSGEQQSDDVSSGSEDSD